jgi:plasmid stabilization system protein ParE
VTYRLLLRRQAKLDLQRTARWYEQQQPGLGRQFIDQVGTALNRIAGSPTHYQVLHRDVRRTITQKFPYGVFYRIDGTDILVFAIIHLHRNPLAWQKRIESDKLQK